MTYIFVLLSIDISSFLWKTVVLSNFYGLFHSLRFVAFDSPDEKREKLP